MSMTLLEQTAAPTDEYLPPRVLKGAMPDGSQVVVTLWDSHTGEVSFRTDDHAPLGDPIEVTKS